MNSFQQAVRDGFLRCRDDCRRSLRIHSQWRWHCLRNDLPCLLTWSVGWMELELWGHWWLSAELFRAITLEWPGAYRQGSYLRFDAVGRKQLKAKARRLLEILRANRPDRQHHWEPQLQHGLAVCTWNEGFEEYLEVGGTYYLREIPAMVGHVVVFVPDGNPLVGIHLERFEFIGPLGAGPRGQMALEGPSF